MSALEVTAPNGVVWKRRSRGTTTGEEFLAALAAMCEFYDVARQWDWWQEGQSERERKLLDRILEQWDHASPPPGGYLSREEFDARWDAKRARREEERQARAETYDKERAMARVRLLSAEATVGFMNNELFSSSAGIC